MKGEKLIAPFPYFGGKSKIADIVWRALGQPKHYIEPFLVLEQFYLQDPIMTRLLILRLLMIKIVWLPMFGELYKKTLMQWLIIVIIPLTMWNLLVGVGYYMKTTIHYVKS